MALPPSSTYTPPILKVLTSLPFRVGLFISFALLPIGLIAVFQTRELGREVQQRLEQSLVGSTGQLAASERSLLQKALGTAETLSFVLPSLSDDAAECSEVLRGYAAETQRYSFLGFVGADGIVTCSTADESRNFSATDIFKRVSANPRPSILSTQAPEVSNFAVLVAVHPVLEDGEFAGYAAASVPHDWLGLEAADILVGPQPVDIVTFNASGEVLTSRRGPIEAKAVLPRDRSLSALAGASSISFRAADTAGNDHIYVVVPIVRDAVYALSIWDPEAPELAPGYFSVTAGVFPLLMWLVSLIVAFLTLNRLVLRHISSLRTQMNQFARRRTLPEETLGLAMPRELREMETDFRYMAEALLQDEARMEGTVREKNVLLKEVHHRVKNNLQLISSIMNMHTRRARNPETKTVLRRLQDRVLGLATVHRMLYQAEDLAAMDAAPMLSEVVNQMLIVGLETGSNVDVRKVIGSVRLFPDQAIPLSLFLSEAVTNALKYLGKGEDGQAWIDISLREVEEGKFEMSIGNSTEPKPQTEDEPDGSGLGTKLMGSFATQLHATVTQQEEAGAYRLTAVFIPRDFSLDAVDY